MDKNWNEIAIRHHGKVYIIGYNTNLYSEGDIKAMILAETDEEDPETDLTDYMCASEMDIEKGEYNKPKLLSILSKNKGYLQFVIV